MKTVQITIEVADSVNPDLFERSFRNHYERYVGTRTHQLPYWMTLVLRILEVGNRVEA
jgi:hypothetical protein